MKRHRKYIIMVVFALLAGVLPATMIDPRCGGDWRGGGCTTQASAEVTELRGYPLRFYEAASINGAVLLGVPIHIGQDHAIKSFSIVKLAINTAFWFGIFYTALDIYSKRRKKSK